MTRMATSEAGNVESGACVPTPPGPPLTRGGKERPPSQKPVSQTPPPSQKPACQAPLPSQQPASQAPLRQGPLSCSTRILAACLLLFAPAGCVSIKANDARVRNAFEDGWERVEAFRGLNVCPESATVLARLGLHFQAQQDPAGTARVLEIACGPDPSPMVRWRSPSCGITLAWLAR